jgi:hypothetical protein
MREAIDQGHGTRGIREDDPLMTGGRSAAAARPAFGVITTAAERLRDSSTNN